MAESSAIATPTENRKIDKVFINGETFDIWWADWVKIFNVSSATDLTNIQKAFDYFRTGKFCVISLAWYWCLYPSEFWIQWTKVTHDMKDWTPTTRSLSDSWFTIVWLMLNWNWTTITKATFFHETTNVIISTSDFEKLSQSTKDNWTHYFIYEEE